MKGFKTLREISVNLGIARGTVKQKAMRYGIKPDKMALDSKGHWAGFYAEKKEAKIVKLFKK